MPIWAACAVIKLADSRFEFARALVYIVKCEVSPVQSSEHIKYSAIKFKSFHDYCSHKVGNE